MRVSDALSHHEHSPALLASQKKTGEVGVPYVKRTQERRLASREQRFESVSIRCEFAAMHESTGHAKSQHQELLEREEMTEDVPQ
jgi:hypothetical protein